MNARVRNSRTILMQIELLLALADFVFAKGTNNCLFARGAKKSLPILSTNGMFG